jgi:hypothetical protein
MADDAVKSLPPFPPHATTSGFLTDAEIDRLIGEHQPLLAEAQLGAGAMDPAVRRSQVVFLKAEEKYRWLYERVWAAARECNRQFFGVDIAAVEPNIQLARYDSGDLGHYTGTPTFADFRPCARSDLHPAFAA